MHKWCNSYDVVTWGPSKGLILPSGVESTGRVREGFNKKKSRIRETKHLSTDADSSTDTTGGWIKNPKKTFFFEKTEKIIQNSKTQKRLEICQI